MGHFQVMDVIMGDMPLIDRYLNIGSIALIQSLPLVAPLLVATGDVAKNNHQKVSVYPTQVWDAGLEVLHSLLFQKSRPNKY